MVQVGDTFRSFSYRSEHILDDHYHSAYETFCKKRIMWSSQGFPNLWHSAFPNLRTVGQHRLGVWVQRQIQPGNRISLWFRACARARRGEAACAHEAIFLSPLGRFRPNFPIPPPADAAAAAARPCPRVRVRACESRVCDLRKKSKRFKKGFNASSFITI